MDDVDRVLVEALMRNARATYQELAQQVHLSANSVADRVRRLNQRGVISGYHAHLGFDTLGRTLTAYTDVRLRDDVDRHQFETRLSEVVHVIRAAHMTGPYDYQLELACHDTADLEDAVGLLRALGARELQSRIVLRSIPLDLVRLLP